MALDIVECHVLSVDCFETRAQNSVDVEFTVAKRADFAFRSVLVREVTSSGSGHIKRLIKLLVIVKESLFFGAIFAIGMGAELAENH